MYQRFSAHLTSVDISGFSFDLSETASRVESALARGSTSSTTSDRSGGGEEGGSAGLVSAANKTFDFGVSPSEARPDAAKTISRSQSVTVPNTSPQKK